MSDNDRIEHAWVANLRRDQRWQEGRLASARFQDIEAVALTGDISLGGLRLAVYGATPELGAKVHLEVAFEQEIIDLCGFVRHATRTEWGSVIGVAFEDNGQTYLARRFIDRSHQG